MNGSPPAACTIASRIRSTLWYLVVISLLLSSGRIEHTFKENALKVTTFIEDSTSLPRGFGGLASHFSVAEESSSMA